MKESRAGKDFPSDDIHEKYLLVCLMLSCAGPAWEEMGWSGLVVVQPKPEQSPQPALLLPWGVTGGTRAGRAACSLRFAFFPFLDAAKGFTGQGKMLHPMFVCVRSNAAVSDVLLSACTWSPRTPELGGIGCGAMCPSNDYSRYLQS